MENYTETKSPVCTKKKCPGKATKHTGIGSRAVHIFLGGKRRFEDAQMKKVERLSDSRTSKGRKIFTTHNH